MSGLPVALALLSWFWMTAACGGGPSMPPDDGLADKVPVTGTVQNPPALIMYREATETEWQPVTMTTPTRFELQPRGPYLLTVVCKIRPPLGNARGAIRIQQFARTPEDPRELPTWCLTQGPHLVKVDVVANQNVSAVTLGSIYGEFEIGSLKWTYSFLMYPGDFDLVVTSRPPSSVLTDRVLIRRGISIPGAMTLPGWIDLDSEAKPTIESVLFPTNPDPTESLASVQVAIETPRGSAVIFRSGHSPPYRAKLVPNNVLEPSDVQTLRVMTKSGQLYRGIQRKFREGDSTAFTFPEFFNGFMFSTADGKPVITWMPLPDHTQLYSSSVGYPADSSHHLWYETFHSRSFVEAMGITSIVPQTDIPGYQPSWLIDVSQAYGQEAYVERIDGNDTLFSSTYISVNTPQVATETAGDPLDLLSMPTRHPDAH